MIPAPAPLRSAPSTLTDDRLQAKAADVLDRVQVPEDAVELEGGETPAPRQQLHDEVIQPLPAVLEVQLHALCRQSRESGVNSLGHAGGRHCARELN